MSLLRYVGGEKERIEQMEIVCSEPETKVYIMIKHQNDVILIDSDILFI